MENKNILIGNLNKLHTTKMGNDRIKRNLSLNLDDTVNWCINKINDDNCKIARKGKNYYVTIDDYVITINAYSYTIITAHKIKPKK